MGFRRGAAIWRGSGNGSGHSRPHARKEGVVAFGIGGDELALPARDFEASMNPPRWASPADSRG